MPTIASISPTSGKVGTAVSISGSGFGATQGSNKVTVGSQPATVSSWSDTGIGITIPTVPVGEQHVVVTVNNTASNPSGFTVNK